MFATSILIHRKALLWQGKGPSGHTVWIDRTPLSFSYVLVESMNVVVHDSICTVGVLIFGVSRPPVKW